MSTQPTEDCADPRRIVRDGHLADRIRRRARKILQPVSPMYHDRPDDRANGASITDTPHTTVGEDRCVLLPHTPGESEMR